MQSINIYNVPQQKIANFSNQIGISNMPTQNQTIKIYKGTSNEVHFVLLDSDNKPLVFSEGYPELVVYNPLTSAPAFRKPLVKVDVTKINVSGSNVPSVRNNNYRNSVFGAIIDAADTQCMDLSTAYKWCISLVTTAGNQLFYTNQDYSVQGEIHLTPSPVDWQDKSIIITDNNWHSLNEYKFMDPAIVGDLNSSIINQWTLFVSDVLFSNGYISNPNANVSFDIKCNNYSGTVVIQGCNEAQIPDDQAYDRWFDVDSFELEKHTGHILKNYKGNYIYLRVLRYQNVNNAGKINRLLFKR